jgi:DNA-directed RNA polymerase subunit beta
MPNLLEIQLRSFRQFLDPAAGEDAEMSLTKVFEKFFPIEDPQGTHSLRFIDYQIGEPKHTIEECRERNLTYEAPLKATLQLVVRSDEGGKKKTREVRETGDIYLGDIPLITDRGTFVINGAERVIVSQLHRSPGVFFQDKVHPNGTRLFFAKMIPYRGTWVEFRMSIRDEMFIRTDRRHKFRMTTFLRALGYSSDEEIYALFYQFERVPLPQARPRSGMRPVGEYAYKTYIDRETGEVIVERGDRLTVDKVTKLKSAGYETIQVIVSEDSRIAILDGKETAEERNKPLIGRFSLQVVKHPKTKEIIINKDERLTETKIDHLRRARIKKIKLAVIEEHDVKIIEQTLGKDKTQDEEEALQEIHRTLKGGNMPTVEAGRELLSRMFFDPERYDLMKVGRYKLNEQLGISREDVPLTVTHLRKEDFVETIRALMEVCRGKRDIDDIDHLGNRRIRSVGELLANQFSAGLSRMARVVRDRMSTADSDTIDLKTLINSRPISAVVKNFFGSNQLSQFMEQTNPLSELTHKRRLSALGTGGLTRERAGFEVRDVHYSHYGRMCPIETPEGPNIGLITSLSTYARINDHGFIESPYYRVVDGRVTDEVAYLSAAEEEGKYIAQADIPVDENGNIVDSFVIARHKSDFPMVPREVINFMEVSPKQLVSVAAALIPFLEHDDANRALMGSNMQRQAVPLLKTERPLIGTGIEAKVAADSGSVVTAVHDGVVEEVGGDRIAIRHYESVDGAGELDVYRLRKFERTNQNTSINQRPLVRKGQSIKAGDVIADGPATRYGELALGTNLLVAFMPWGGYNFEDAILISEKLVKEDRFTSVHIEEFEAQVRETKRGTEEFTNEIPNVGESALKHLDDNGLASIGTRVVAGDILIGKVTPKGETELSPEENLLRAIFGEKACDVRDASLKAPPGMEGIVIGRRLFSRKPHDEKSKREVEKQVKKLKERYRRDIQKMRKERNTRILALSEGMKTASVRDSKTFAVMARAGRNITEDLVSSMEFEKIDWSSGFVEDKELNEKIRKLVDQYEQRIQSLNIQCDRKCERLKLGEDLPRGVVKLAKVYVATKRRLSVGDKMAGRHGNKGVVAKIMAEEDMPFLPDGTPVEIVLNPLGVPSRMNLGQILETHLGWAAKLLGLHLASPVFEGIELETIKNALESSGLPRSGKTPLHDGRTGEPFAHPVTVGYIYMMKLGHLVDDKIHARSIGPYSLVTQQPLGGKAQFGGQRFGEMEVWALEAYGAAHALQEMLTVKSDDVVGRSRTYEAIVKGENPPTPGTPASFNVLVRELQSLGLDVELE